MVGARHNLHCGARYPSKAKSFDYMFFCYFKFLAQSCHQAKIHSDNWKSYSICTKMKIPKKNVNIFNYFPFSWDNLFIDCLKKGKVSENSYLGICVSNSVWIWLIKYQHASCGQENCDLDSNMIINKIHIPRLVHEFHDKGRWTLLVVLHEVITEVSLFHFLDISMILTKKVKITTTRLLGRVVKFSE